MKSIIALTFLVLTSSWAAFGQSTRKTEPLILRGKLTNSPEPYLKVFFNGDHEELLIDTIRLNPDGSFYLKTFKIKAPQITSIQQKKVQVNDIFVAPGYDLMITGDASNFDSLIRSTAITGRGSESNQYHSLLSRWYIKHREDTPWYELKGPALLKYAKNERKVKDSLALLVFDKKGVDDPYFKFFKKMVLLDNQFMNLYYLLSYVDQNEMSYDESVHFVPDNFNQEILNNLVKDEYLISKNYKNWVIGSSYIDYLIKLDYMRDSTLRNKKGYKVSKIANTYSGKVKDCVLYRQMSNGITFAKSYEQLNDQKEIAKPYIDDFTDKHYSSILMNQLSAKEEELARTAVGKAAPAFTLTSDKGKTYSLADFKGKVIFLDLWASWCAPCRVQTPHLTKLYNQYKNDERIAFISVAVNDGKKEWEKALEEDQPGWLQLLDRDDSVSKSYVANMIPQFVIINKKGEIVNFNAPEPSSGKMLQDILVTEMEKKE